MIDFNREEIQKQSRNRFHRRNIFNNLKKKKDFSRENTIILIFRIFILIFVTFFNLRVNLN